ncbi:hypothetical protein [Polyangium sorediatum]|uniref:Uncharacterized protein n=1 Tax=Polyangium sorediatum TaxID=889274 RepID=A0ABT6NMP8_9BACT|nr:hypothetical protein [Polyangium sorediatum]MDI1429600.1 hypothetical protein [Polyangium sorediatum]
MSIMIMLVVEANEANRRVGAGGDDAGRGPTRVRRDEEQHLAGIVRARQQPKAAAICAWL